MKSVHYFSDMSIQHLLPRTGDGGGGVWYRGACDEDGGGGMGYRGACGGDDGGGVGYRGACDEDGGGGVGYREHVVGMVEDVSGP